MVDLKSDAFKEKDAVIYALGKLAAQQNDFAIEMLKEFASGDDITAALAHTQLASVYAPVSEHTTTGYDPKQVHDYARWISHLDRAAELGCPYTLNWYGSSLINGGADFPVNKDRGKAMMYRAIEMGNTASMIQMIGYLVEGRHLPKDHKEAQALIDKALSFNLYEFEVERLHEVKEQLDA